MSSETVQIRMSGLDPVDNMELQKSIRDAKLNPDRDLSITLDHSRFPDQRYGEPGTLALAFEIVRTVAPTVLGLLSLWLEWRRSRPANERPRPVRVDVSLPSGERFTLDVDPSDNSSSTSAGEILLKAAEKLASAAAK